MREDAILELIEARRVIEQELTALAAQPADARQLAEIRQHLVLMRAAEGHPALVRNDSDFHASVARASGNATLAAILIGLSRQTLQPNPAPGSGMGSWTPTPSREPLPSTPPSMQPSRPEILSWPLQPPYCTSAPRKSGCGGRLRRSWGSR
jgi:hypothetical protein